MPTHIRDIPLASHVVTFIAEDGAPCMGVLIRRSIRFVHLVGSLYLPPRGWSAETVEYYRRFDGVLGFIPPGISTDASRDKLKTSLAEAFDATPLGKYGSRAARRDALVAVLEAHNVELVKRVVL